MWSPILNTLDFPDSGVLTFLLLLLSRLLQASPTRLWVFLVMTSLLFPGHAHAAMKDLSSSSSPLTTLLHYPSSKTSIAPFSPSAGPAPSPGPPLSAAASAPLSKPQPFCLQTAPHLLASMQLQKLNSHYQNLTGASAGHPAPGGAQRGFGASPLGAGSQLLGPSGGLGGAGMGVGIAVGNQSSGAGGIIDFDPVDEEVLMSLVVGWAWTGPTSCPSCGWVRTSSTSCPTCRPDADRRGGAKE
uniref:Histone deacetylase 8 n=1 Tax=Scophthalmus maximus TaxID=52904 RepID=A0A8D3C1T9_SCOMX